MQRKSICRLITHWEEQPLKVPYFLLFHPEEQELSLYRHKGKKYVSVKPNKQGRYPIGQLELEVALHEGWIRFWYQGRLLPLPGDLRETWRKRNVKPPT
jgi:hypothetical protein